MQLVITLGTLGRVLKEVGASARAIPILREAVSLCEMAIEKANGQSWENLLASPDYIKSTSELGNLSTAMGDLSNALRNEGYHSEALSAAEKSLEISKCMGNHREIAAGHSQCASILLADRRYREADSRYDLALSAARQVGDKELVGKILQHQGALADNQGQFERASHIYQQALQYFQAAGERRSVMLTYNLLGVTEAKVGRLAEARAWFEGSSELALELQDQNCLGQAVQNIGITCRDEGDAARGRGAEVAARQHFEEALRFGNESLRIKQGYSSKPEEASAWSSLAQIHFRLGDLASADHHAHEARKIRESLDLKEVYKDYDNLSEIAHARGDLDAAAEWAKKRDDLLHELERQGGGGVGLPSAVQGAQALTLACVKAGFEDGGFGPEEDEALGQMAELPVPFSGYVAFLRQIAQGQLPPIPNGLPGELRQWVEGVVQEIRKAPQ